MRVAAVWRRTAALGGGGGGVQQVVAYAGGVGARTRAACEQQCCGLRMAVAWVGVYGRRRGVAVALERRIERRRCGVGKNKGREAGVRGQDTYMTGGTRDFL